MGFHKNIRKQVKKTHKEIEETFENFQKRLKEIENKFLKEDENV